MKKAELLIEAKQLGIEGLYKMNKAELEKKILIFKTAVWFNSIIDYKLQEYDIDNETVNQNIYSLKK